MNYKTFQKLNKAKNENSLKIIHKRLQCNYDNLFNRSIYSSKCKKCGASEFKVHGYYTRQVYINTEAHLSLQVGRLRCISCNQTMTVLPPYLIKFKRYVVYRLFALLLSLMNFSIRKTQKKFKHPISYLKYILYQFESMHKTGLHILNHSLDPPDIIQLVHQYESHFNYRFMQILTSP